MKQRYKLVQCTYNLSVNNTDLCDPINLSFLPTLFLVLPMLSHTCMMTTEKLIDENPAPSRIQIKALYFSTALRRVQITPETSKLIMRTPEDQCEICPHEHKTPPKRSQLFNTTYCNIVGCNMLCAFGHPVVTCWVLLVQI